MHDLAQRLGVSVTTVSRALQDHHSIGRKTKDSVKKLADELGYQRNSMAAALRKKKSNTIGVIVPQIARPFISSMISGIEQVANEAGFSVLISQSSDLYQKEVKHASSLYSSDVDGLIVSLAMETQNYDHFSPFLDHDVPVVMVDRVTEKLEVDKVIINNFSAAFQATEHLIASGYRRIAHMGGAAHRNIYRERKKGYLAALQKHGLVTEEALITDTILSIDAGIESTRRLMNLANPPDAIFAANDTTAVQSILYLQELGIDVPQEVGVVGFNNDPISVIVQPNLTTVSHPADEMGIAAAKQLVDKIDGERRGIETITIETELIVRDSSTKRSTNPAEKSTKGLISRDVQNVQNII